MHKVTGAVKRSIRRNLGIISGKNNRELSIDIARLLNVPLTSCEITQFADGETNVEILQRCHRKDMYLIQSLSKPVNYSLIELLVLLDTLKRESPREITCILPYLCYSRQDRIMKPGTTISASLIAKLIESVRVNKIVTLDIHSQQNIGFFHNTPVINLEAKDVLALKLHQVVPNLSNHVTIVSPDAGGVKRADEFKKSLSILSPDARLSSAMTIKKREIVNQVSSMQLIGSVEGSDAVIVDDMIDTGNTLVKCAQMLRDNGAKRVFACATHGLFNQDCLDKIQESVLEKVVITNSVSKRSDAGAKIIYANVAKLFSDFILQNH